MPHFEMIENINACCLRESYNQMSIHRHELSERLPALVIDIDIDVVRLVAWIIISNDDEYFGNWPLA